MLLKVLRKTVPFFIFGQFAGGFAGYAWHADPAEQTWDKRQKTELIINDDGRKLLAARHQLDWTRSGAVVGDIAELSRNLEQQHERVIQRVVLEGSEADFRGMVSHVAHWSDLPTPSYLAELKGNGSFLEECRAVLPGKPAQDVAACAVSLTEKNLKQSYAVAAGTSAGFTLIPLAGFFAGAVRRRRAEKKSEGEAKARLEAERAGVEQYKTDLEALKNMLTPKSR